MTLLITFFLISIVFSFLCSLWEAALLSVTPTYAQIQIKEGKQIGKRLAGFKQNIDKPLAAILTLNTIAHTVGAIGVGVQASSVWSGAHPLITTLIVPAIMTLAILLLSEIVPKTLGATYWKELAPFTVNALTLIMFLLAPLIWACQLLTGLLKKNTEGSIFSRSDFLAMAEIGAKEGVFEKNESTIISNLIKFQSVCVEDIMTPRTVVIAAPENASLETYLQENPELRVSRIPIFQNENRDEITGYVLRSDLLSAVINGESKKLIGAFRRDIMIVEEAFPLPELLDRLLTRREHIAVVVDEFGGLSGIVTTEDAIETLLGLEIVDESDAAVDLRKRARAEWGRRAKARGLVEETFSPSDMPESSIDK